MHRVAERAQPRVVEDVIEHVRAPAPGVLLRLHRTKSGARELPHQRVVTAHVEVAPDQRRALRLGDLLHHQLALGLVHFAARIEHEEGEQVGVEDEQLAAVDRGLGADHQAVGRCQLLALELELYRRRRQVPVAPLAQGRFGKDRQPDPERKLARIGLGVVEIAVVVRKLGAQPGIVRRRIGLGAARLGLLEFLQQDDVRVALADLGDRPLELDRRLVRVAVAPDPPELHVELDDPEFSHWRRGTGPVSAHCTKKIRLARRDAIFESCRPLAWRQPAPDPEMEGRLARREAPAGADDRGAGTRARERRPGAAQGGGRRADLDRARDLPGPARRQERADRPGDVALDGGRPDHAQRGAGARLAGAAEDRPGTGHPQPPRPHGRADPVAARPGPGLRRAAGAGALVRARRAAPRGRNGVVAARAHRGARRHFRSRRSTGAGAGCSTTTRPGGAAT